MRQLVFGFSISFQQSIFLRIDFNKLDESQGLDLILFSVLLARFIGARSLAENCWFAFSLSFFFFCLISFFSFFVYCFYIIS